MWFWEALDNFTATHAHLVTDLSATLVQNRAETYAKSIHQSGAVLDKCICFIDGSKIRCACPSGSYAKQRCLYSGHKRCHCLTYQKVTAPDGQILHFTVHANDTSTTWCSTPGLASKRPCQTLCSSIECSTICTVTRRICSSPGS